MTVGDLAKLLQGLDPAMPVVYETDWVHGLYEPLPSECVSVRPSIADGFGGYKDRQAIAQPVIMVLVIAVSDWDTPDE